VTVLILFEYSIESFSWFIKSNLIILFKDNRGICLSLRFVVSRQLLSKKLQLMNILKRSLMGIIEVNSNCNWEFTVARIMNFKRCLINSNNWLRKTLMDLKFYLFNQERKVLLLHLIRVVFFQSTHITPPFVLKWPIFSANADRPLQTLSNRAYNNWYGYFYSRDTLNYLWVLDLIICHDLISRLIHIWF